VSQSLSGLPAYHIDDRRLLERDQIDRRDDERAVEPSSVEVQLILGEQALVQNELAAEDRPYRRQLTEVAAGLTLELLSCGHSQARAAGGCRYRVKVGFGVAGKGVDDVILAAVIAIAPTKQRLCLLRESRANDLVVLERRRRRRVLNLAEWRVVGEKMRPERRVRFV
jgi:hypothetical protein